MVLDLLRKKVTGGALRGFYNVSTTRDRELLQFQFVLSEHKAGLEDVVRGKAVVHDTDPFAKRPADFQLSQK